MENTTWVGNEDRRTADGRVIRTLDDDGTKRVLEFTKNGVTISEASFANANRSAIAAYIAAVAGEATR